MQICAAITEKCILSYSSNKGVYTHVLRVKEDNKTIFRVILCVSDNEVCKLAPPLPGNVYSVIAQYHR